MWEWIVVHLQDTETVTINATGYLTNRTSTAIGIYVGPNSQTVVSKACWKSCWQLKRPKDTPSTGL